MTLTAKEIESRFKEHHERLTKVEVDVWIGKDAENPAIVMRIDRLEQAAAAVTQLKWIVTAAILAIVGDIISNHIKF
jgi:protein gp37